MAAAKAVSAAILEGDVPFLSSLPVLTDPAPGLTPDERGSVGIYIGWEKREPFQTTLRLVPRALHLGLGCRRGTAEEAIRRLKGIDCGGKGTSCPDQLARALTEMLNGAGN